MVLSDFIDELGWNDTTKDMFYPEFQYGKTPLFVAFNPVTGEWASKCGLTLLDTFIDMRHAQLCCVEYFNLWRH